MRILYIFILILFLLASCKSEEKEENSLLTLLPSSYTNVTFSNQLTENDQFNIIEYLYFNNGAGVAAGDINNDGLADLYFTSNQGSNKLYLNKGNLVFSDITEKAGVAGTGNWKTGVTMADVNGDGFLDIYVCGVGNYKSFDSRNQLFINNGDLTFSEKAQEFGLYFQGFSTQAAFFDYDNDGDLDMYLLNHSVHTVRSYGGISLRSQNDPKAGDRLYRNDQVNGRIFFTDVTKESGIYSSQIGYGLGVSISDINKDGFPDIYISNDFHENDYLYLNNRNGTFSESLSKMTGHTSRSSMGNDIADFNNDGLPDILVLDMLPDDEKIRKQSGGEDDMELSMIKEDFGYAPQFVRNTLQLNIGGNLFSEIGLLSGIASTDWSWSPLFCDIDNDGWKDIFITSGIYRRANDLDYVRFLTGGNRLVPLKDNSNVPDKDLYEKMPLYPNVNYLFRNNRNLTFTNENNGWGSGPRSYSNGSAFADLDNDGDPDLIVNNINSEAYIYRNNSEKNLKNHFLSVKLKGYGLNTRGTGARVTLYAGKSEQLAEQNPTRGFMSASSDILLFGLGSEIKADSLVVRWPDQSVQKLMDLAADTAILLDHMFASAPLKITNKGDNNNRLFSEVSVNGLEFRHKEDPYTDLARENLIPHTLSAEGPALASSDVNNDGLEDLFIGGAKGQESKIFIQQKNGSFKSLKVPLLTVEMDAEDVDAAFFDAEGDGDKDLYIVRGGNELPAGNMLLYDILLINDGKGGFSRGELPFISHTGSCIRPCDFDNDGDTDLFAGSRSVPGSYGLYPYQFLLENDGSGHFQDVTDNRSAGLRNAGMVTDAVWTDFDGDGDKDLITTGEWMKISVFRNDKGSFTDATLSAGLEKTSGWWYSIQAADIDNDGDQDLVCGNLGLNSMLKASHEHPVEMFINDYDNNGSPDQIICSYINGALYPFAPLDEVIGQISYLKNAFSSYSDFAGKSIGKIFPEALIEGALRRNAETFESVLMVNNGSGSFSPGSLPAEAQFSPVRSILIEDFDRDGNKDILLAGNNFRVRPSYGRYDASYGWFLKGSPVNEFNTLMPYQSGMIIHGDARKVLPLMISGEPYIVAAVNNGNIQVFRLNKRSANR